LRALQPHPGTDLDWQPGYALWASSVYAGAIGGTIAASRLSAWIVPDTAGWGFPTLMQALEADSAPAPVLALSLALAFVLVSVLPGLMSLFLITVTDVRLRLHPLIGAAFFGLGAGWVTQSLGGAVFGAVFGLVSLGITAGLLAARRHQDRRVRP
jgi:hypothetical protein